MLVGFSTMAYAEDELYIQNDAFVSTFNGQSNTVMLESNPNTLIIGKGRHAYIRLSVSNWDSQNAEKVVLNFNKKNNKNTMIIKQCSEFLREGESDSQEVWTQANITYNNRPLDLEGSWELEQEIPNGEARISVDLTDLLKQAKQEGKETVSLHITTAAVEDSTVSASELFSTRSEKKPYLDLTYVGEEQPIAVEPTKVIGGYTENGSIAQKIFKIKNESGTYLKLQGTDFVETEKSEEAAVFGLYIFDYKEFDDASYTKTTYALKCLDNNKYLTIQNYFAETDTEKPYYNLENGTYKIQADADTVNWNERFYVSYYPTSNEYTISSHLDTLRDNPDFNVAPVRMENNTLYSSFNNQSEYRFEFEEVTGQDPLEVIQEVNGSCITLRWYPVNGDTNPANYQVDGAAVQLEGDYLTAQLEEKNTGLHTISVSYIGGETVQVPVRIFEHLGMSHSLEELDAMKEHIAKKEEPWYSDYQKLKSTVPDQMSTPDFVPNAQEGVGRGTPEGHGNIVSFEQSANAAYFNALQWVITGEQSYADAVVRILNAWAEQLKIVDGRDRILGAAINSYKFNNAAEIIRYYHGGYANYTEQDFQKFQTMMENVIYPVIEDLGAPMIANGNWDTAAMISMISIGVLCDNTEIYERAVSLYQDIHVNGSIAVYVSDWGQSVESARDQAHAQLGIGYMADVCQVAWNQGDDLYGLYDNRLAKAFNWAAQYNLYDDNIQFEPLMNVFGDSKRGYWTKLDSEKINRGELRPVYELPLAHYSNVSGVDTTWMEKAAKAMRAQGYVHNDNLNFGTMTSYNGEPTTACKPYFQLRTRLEPWYQRTWDAVNQYGDSSNGTAETLNSYFTVTQTGELTASSMKASAPYFQLIDNQDGTYSIICVENGKYLSVKEETRQENQVIRADAETIGENEKFIFHCTGAGFYYFCSPKYGNRVVTVQVENAEDPQNAVLTLCLGTSTDISSAAITNNEKFILIYNNLTEPQPQIPVLKYQSHVQNIGWMTEVSDGEISGTHGRCLRMEALKIDLDTNGLDGGIQYCSHIQNLGWQKEVSNRELSGTTGRCLRMEAVKIRLTGEIEEQYNIYYRAHIQNIGWLGWAKNGEAAGSQGKSLRLEAVQIRLIKKGQEAPDQTDQAFIK